jgi:hypothetical protein
VPLPSRVCNFRRFERSTSTSTWVNPVVLCLAPTNTRLVTYRPASTAAPEVCPAAPVLVPPPTESRSSPSAFCTLASGFGPLPPTPPNVASSGADLRDLQYRQLRCALAEEEARENLILGQGWGAAQVELRRIGKARDVQCRGCIGGRCLRGEVESRIDLVLESRAIEADSSAAESQCAARERKRAADEIEAATAKQVVGAAAKVHVAAEFGIHPAPLHQQIPRGMQIDVESNQEFALGRCRRRLTRTAHVEHRDVGRQAIGNTDDSAIQVYRAGYVNALAQRAFYFEVGVQIRSQNVACNRLSVLRGELQVDGKLRLQDSDRARHRQLPRRCMCD